MILKTLASRLASVGVTCRTEKVGSDIQIPSTDTAINIETGNSDIRGKLAKAMSNFSKVSVCIHDKKLIQTLSEQMKDSRIRFAMIERAIDTYLSMQIDAGRKVR